MVKHSRPDGRKYSNALRRIVSAAPEPKSRPLPLTHVTDCIRLKSILDSGQLEPRKCPVFGERRLCLFYARPAYRNAKIGPLHNLNYAPVCFVLDAAIAGQHGPDEVFALDTGALNNGILAEDIHSDLSPCDFALEPKIDSAQRLVRLFYGDEKSYFLGRCRTDLPPHNPTDAEMVAYESLVRRGANKDRDERGTSVELQFRKPLPINSKLVGIILPQEFLDDPIIVKKVAEKKIAALPYPFIPDHTVKEVVGIFYAFANDLYRRKKKQYGWQW